MNTPFNILRKIYIFTGYQRKCHRAGLFSTGFFLLSFVSLIKPKRVDRPYTPPLVRRFVKKHKNSHAKSQSNATSELNGTKHGFTSVECKLFVGFTFSEYGKLKDFNKRLLF